MSRVGSIVERRKVPQVFQQKSFCLALFGFDVDGMPQALTSRLHQLACAKIAYGCDGVRTHRIVDSLAPRPCVF